MSLHRLPLHHWAWTRPLGLMVIVYCGFGSLFRSVLMVIVPLVKPVGSLTRPSGKKMTSSFPSGAPAGVGGVQVLQIVTQGETEQSMSPSTSVNVCGVGAPFAGKYAMFSNTLVGRFNPGPVCAVQLVELNGLSPRYKLYDRWLTPVWKLKAACLPCVIASWRVDRKSVVKLRMDDFILFDW